MQQKELARRLASKQPPVVVDVRSGSEFASGHIPGAVHAPGWKIVLGISPLPSDREAEFVVTCEIGPRAQMAAKTLAVYGYRKIHLLEGHMAAWRRAGLPLER